MRPAGTTMSKVSETDDNCIAADSSSAIQFSAKEVLFFPEGRQAVTNQRKVNKAVLRIRIRFIYLCISFEDYYRIQRNPYFWKKRGLNRTE